MIQASNWELYVHFQVDWESWMLKLADFFYTLMFADKLQTGLAIADIDHSVLHSVRLRMPIEQVI